MKALLVILGNCLDKAEWQHKFPHTTLMCNCKCGQRKKLFTNGNLLLINCVEYMADNGKHDIPIEINNSVDVVNSSNWQPYVVYVNKKNQHISQKQFNDNSINNRDIKAAIIHDCIVDFTFQGRPIKK